MPIIIKTFRSSLLRASKSVQFLHTIFTHYIIVRSHSEREKVVKKNQMVRRKRDRATLASSNPAYSQSSSAVRIRAHACHVPVASVLSDLTIPTKWKAFESMKAPPTELSTPDELQ